MALRCKTSSTGVLPLARFYRPGPTYEGWSVGLGYNGDLGVAPGRLGAYSSNQIPNAGWAVATSSTYADGVEHAIAVTWDGTTLRFYRDGRADGSTTSFAGPGTYTGAWMLADAVAATVQAFRLYDRALSASEVARVAADPWAGMVWRPSRWLFEPTSGGTYNDTIADAATAADSFTTTRVAASSLTDSAASADTVAAANTTAASTTDAATAAETLATALTTAGSLSDAATAADTQAPTLTAAGTVSDSAAAADATTGNLGAQTYNSSVTDAATASEVVAAGLIVPATLADAVTAARTLATALAAGGAISDSAAGADAAASTRTTSASLADTVAVGDLAYLTGVVVITPAARTYRLPAAPRRHILAAELRSYRLPAEPRRYTAPPEA